MSITQENLENIIVEAGELDKLLKYVSVSPLALNDIMKGKICEIMEELRNQEMDLSFFSKIASILETKGLPESQIKSVLMMMANARKDEREELRSVKVGYNPVFVSGLQTANRVLEMGPGKLLQGWIFTNGQADASVSFYDSPDLTDIQPSSFLFRVSCVGANLQDSNTLAKELGFTALTAILTGEGASYSVLYRTLERGKGGKG